MGKYYSVNPVLKKKKMYGIKRWEKKNEEKGQKTEGLKTKK